MIFFSRLHCRVSARLFVVIFKGLSASPLDKLFRESVYLIECSPLFPYGLVCQKVPCTSESISGSLHGSQEPQFPFGWGVPRAHRNTHGWRLSLAKQTLVSNTDTRKKRARDVRGNVFPSRAPFFLVPILFMRAW